MGCREFFMEPKALVLNSVILNQWLGVGQVVSARFVSMRESIAAIISHFKLVAFPITKKS
jgi:hypothetical protein